MITSQQLRDILDYSPETGLFTWRVFVSSRAYPGKIAGSYGGKGYWVISIDQKKYLAHRLAWLYVNGEWPRSNLDHRNLNKIDNRIKNLREATVSENGANVPVGSQNTSGFKGVSWHKRARKWQASIKINGRNVYLGLFASADDAHLAYRNAAKAAFGAFARAA